MPPQLSWATCKPCLCEHGRSGLPDLGAVRTDSRASSWAAAQPHSPHHGLSCPACLGWSLGMVSGHCSGGRGQAPPRRCPVQLSLTTWSPPSHSDRPHGHLETDQPSFDQTCTSECPFLLEGNCPGPDQVRSGLSSLGTPSVPRASLLGSAWPWTWLALHYPLCKPGLRGFLGTGWGTSEARKVLSR